MTAKPTVRGRRGYTSDPCKLCKGTRQRDGERPRDNVCSGCQTLLRHAERIIAIHEASQEHSHLQIVPRLVDARLNGAYFDGTGMRQVVNAAAAALTRLARSIGIPFTLNEREKLQPTVTGGGTWTAPHALYSEDQISDFGDLADAISTMLAVTYNRGHSDGGSVLRRLSQGDLSVLEFEEEGRRMPSGAQSRLDYYLPATDDTARHSPDPHEA